jgi:hypothetical protein
MLRFLVATFLIFVATIARSESGLVILIKNPPVYAFVQATEKSRAECWRISRGYWDAVALASYGKGSPEPQLRETLACVVNQRDIPKPNLVLALKYLEAKPGSSKALKECYLKWVAYLESTGPEAQENHATNARRMKRAGDAFEESLRSLELELELGT